jgi:hypothetical protein
MIKSTLWTISGLRRSGTLVLWSHFSLVWSCLLWFGSGLVLQPDQPKPSGFPDVAHPGAEIFLVGDARRLLQIVGILAARLESLPTYVNEDNVQTFGYLVPHLSCLTNTSSEHYIAQLRACSPVCLAHHHEAATHPTGSGTCCAYCRPKYGGGRNVQSNSSPRFQPGLQPGFYIW